MSWYKARAIYNGGGRFELLYDRQTASGKDAQPLVDWLNNTAYKIMRKLLRVICIYPLHQMQAMAISILGLGLTGRSRIWKMLVL